MTMQSDESREIWTTEIQERRSARRIPTAIDARLELPDGAIHGVVENISFGGAMFVTRTVRPVLALRSRIVLRVRPLSDGPRDDLAWAGTVVRADRSGDDGPDRVAYAIAFVVMKCAIGYSIPLTRQPRCYRSSASRTVCASASFM